MSLEIRGFNPELNNNMNNQNTKWDPEEARRNMEEEFLKRKTLQEVRRKPLEQRLKEAEEEDKAALAELEGRISKDKYQELKEALLTNIDTYDESSFDLNYLKKLCETEPDSLTEEMLNNIPLKDLKALFNSLFDENGLTATDEGVINLIQKIIAEKEGQAEQSGGIIMSETKVFKGPDTHA